MTPASLPGDTGVVTDRNVLGGELEPCGIGPLTGFYRDGCCRTGPEDRGSHTICAVVTSAFLEHQRRIGNDLITPMPQYHFPGLTPGDRWCVTAVNWLRAHEDGAAAYVVLASTHERALEVVSLAALQEHTVDVPGSGTFRGLVRDWTQRCGGIEVVKIDQEVVRAHDLDVEWTARVSGKVVEVAADDDLGTGPDSGS